MIWSAEVSFLAGARLVREEISGSESVLVLGLPISGNRLRGFAKPCRVVGELEDDFCGEVFGCALRGLPERNEKSDGHKVRDVVLGKRLKRLSKANPMLTSHIVRIKGR